MLFRSVLISVIDLASVAVVAKFNKFEGAEIHLLQATRPPSLKQKRLLIFSDFKASFNILVCVSFSVRIWMGS